MGTGFAWSACPCKLGARALALLQAGFEEGLFLNAISRGRRDVTIQQGKRVRQENKYLVHSNTDIW